MVLPSGRQGKGRCIRPRRIPRRVDRSIDRRGCWTSSPEGIKSMSYQHGVAHSRSVAVAALVLMVGFHAFAADNNADDQAIDLEELAEMSIEDLMNVSVVSLAGVEQE